jgi:hypothetical protein
MAAKPLSSFFCGILISMDTLMHADIFFFVTTIVVVVVGIVLTVVLIYLITILHRVRNIADMIREETMLFREDVHEFRASVKREGFKISNMISSFANFGSFGWLTKFFGKPSSTKNKRSKG